MSFGSLSNVLEVKNAEGFRGSSVLQQSYPLTGYASGGGGPSAFTPLSLFSGGVQGVWYDPSDLTTMFQDSAGTTPVGTPGNGSAQPVGRILDKSGNANHATQSTSSARPTLSALYNILTNTEDFNSFGKDNITVTTNTTTAPDGTLTADSIYENSTTGAHDSYFGATPNCVFSVALKAGNRTWAWLYSNNGSARSYFDLSNGVLGTVASGSNASITSLGNGWYRCSINTQTGFNCGFGPATGDGVSNYTGDPTKFIYAWGIDQRLQNDVAGLPAYQRVGGDTNTYDSTGFPYYLSFNGVDRFLQCDDTNMPTGNLSGFFAAKNNSGSGSVLGYGQATAGNSVILFFNIGTSPAWSQYGSAVASSFNTLTKVVAGGTRVGSTYTIRAQGGAYSNSGTMTTATLLQGTNGFGFGRNGAGSSTGYLNGRIYGTILCGSVLNATQITNTETWLNGKAKAY